MMMGASGTIKIISMGKGDKKTRRGKIQRGSYGVRRPKIKKRPTTLEKIDVDKKGTWEIRLLY